MDQNDQEQPVLMTLPEAARRAGVGLRQIRRARDRGQLTLYQVGGWPRVRWREVLVWIECKRRGVEHHRKAKKAQTPRFSRKRGPPPLGPPEGAGG